MRVECNVTNGVRPSQHDEPKLESWHIDVLISSVWR